jgi:hypothetical protein
MSDQQGHNARQESGSLLGEGGVRQTVDLAPASATEPCLGCGEETAPGSVFYSDRREIDRDDGMRVFLCFDCRSAAHRARKGVPLTEEDLRTIANNGMMIGAGFFTGGGA